jgi:hypothetical protein
MFESKLIGLQFFRFSISPFFGISFMEADRKLAVKRFFSKQQVAYLNKA